ncbi:MAG: hypothetical protein CMJ80_16440 [Planctomycetaceae bacterium]|nr:hypothetical protein [Planctomycetaceae bacterium]
MEQDLRSRCRSLMHALSTLAGVLVLLLTSTGICGESQAVSDNTVVSADEVVLADTVSSKDKGTVASEGVATAPVNLKDPNDSAELSANEDQSQETVSVVDTNVAATTTVDSIESTAIDGVSKQLSLAPDAGGDKEDEAKPAAEKLTKPRGKRRLEARRPNPPPPVEIPSAVVLLRQPIEQALKLHVTQRLNTADDSCWSMMHAIIGWGGGTEVLLGGRRGQPVSALRRIASNQTCGGRQLFYLDGDLIKGREGPGYQGHPAQFLAVAAQVGVQLDYPMYIQGSQYRIADLVESEKRTCFAGYEQTFKLLSLSHYVGTEDVWQNDRQQTWSIERLLSVELSQPVNGAACGGTHRLMAISYAIAKRRFEGAPITGIWQIAEKYIADYHRYALTLQNRDGSFSSEWFRRRANRQDIDRSLQTTGHMLEWLAFSLPDDAIFDPRIVRATNYLATTLRRHRHHDWEVGPKGHAIRALRLYHQRVFKRQSFQLGPLASQTQRGTNRR